MNTEARVTAEHVVQHLDVAKDTVYRWREHKGLPVPIRDDQGQAPGWD